MKATEKEITRLRARRDDIAGRLHSATADAEAATLTQRNALIDANDIDASSLRRLEADCAATASRRDALADALREAEARIAEAETKLAADRDRLERERVADDLERRAAAIDAATQALVASIASLADTHRHLIQVIRADGIPMPEAFMGAHQPSAEHLALSIINNALGTALPSLWFGVDLRAPDDVAPSIDGAAAARELQTGRMRALAQAIRAGAASVTDAVPPPQLHVPPVPVYAETRIVLRKAISYVGVDSRFVPVSTGEMGVPEPVARAAVEKGLGAIAGTAEAKQILIDLAKSRHGNTGTDGGWIDVGVDLGRFSERRSEAA
jgi:hypothetical protein